MRNTVLRIGLVLVAIIGISEWSLADSIVNGGFETGTLTGWTTAGDVAVIGAFAATDAIKGSFQINPIEGSFQAALSNSTNDTGLCGRIALNCFTFSGHDSLLVAFGVGTAQLQSVLGVPITGPVQNYWAPGTVAGVSESLNHDHFLVYNGSAMSQSFFGNAGDILSFYSSFLTYDGPFIDVAVVTLDGSISPLFGAFSATLTTTGVHQLGIGIFNTNDGLLPSALFVDNVTLTAVPEPTTFVLLGSGLVGLIVIHRRTRASFP